MRYVFYTLTMAILFLGGMLVGNIYLPQRDAVLAASVSVPDLSDKNPILQKTSLKTALTELTVLNQALQSCPVVVNEEKDKLVNHIKLLLAVEDFALKKAKLELEMAKNKETNRPTAQFMQATENYNAAREYAEKMADEFFPVHTEEQTVTQVTETPAPAEKPAN